MYLDENFDNRSEEVQEILGTPPHWLLNWGTVLALVAFCLLAWLSFWVEYPDIVKDSIRITFKDPPVRFLAQEGNYIDRVLVRDNQRVETGQALMVFRTSANFNHVMSLADRIKNLPNEEDTTLANFSLDTVLILGELQEDLYNFFQKQSEYQQARMRRFESSDVATLQRQIGTAETAIDLRKAEKSRNANLIDQFETELLTLDYQYKLGKVSLSDITTMRNKIATLQEGQQGLDAAIRDRQFEIASLRTRINSVQQGSMMSRTETSSDMVDAYLKLKLRMEAFLKKNILVAPFDGVVQIVGRNVTSGQFVQEGDELLVVLPKGERQLIGEMQIPFTESGKVRTRQKVVIRVNGYPYTEYGSVIGEVSWKSKVTRKVDGLVVVPIEVRLPQPLVTHSNKSILSEEELSGEARIITAERRFIERIIGSPRGFRR
ncbi:MAG: HlyD family efflux transporter periplasmic adaptor subunit [Haliscomenobacter sp.]|nr:HlyD family efflux transporter periplasmic adaptor subunit [Haliscomenobacter sp.]